MKRLLTLCLGLLLAGSAFAAEPRKPGEYPLTEDSFPHAEVAKGQLIGPLEFKSKIIAGNTVRQYWIYVPAGYDRNSPPNLLVWQDAQRALPMNLPLRLNVVLDNLIAKKEIPPTLGIFITPGQRDAATYPANLGTGNPNNRAQEYDALSDAYARFLTEELLPEVARRYAFTSDPKKRAIGGTSSGAICSFTVAWHKPEAFGTVISFIGSYTSIGYRPATATAGMLPGGDTYPGLIRRAAPKPVRIFLQDGSNDLNNNFGNWFLANQQMLSALNFANATADASTNAAVKNGPRWDVKYEWGDGAHADNHGGWLLPGILRWMFGP
ncbi:MAG TPA: alpha/beta hydrolase-fold protein [Rhizomicrobium sp.]|nr:alpha/beta hydrolase-fold protein [Rhizomicrobium sp.]